MDHRIWGRVRWKERVVPRFFASRLSVGLLLHILFVIVGRSAYAHANTQYLSFQGTHLLRYLRHTLFCTFQVSAHQPLPLFFPSVDC